MSKLGIAGLVSLALIGCDLGSKSVTGTADDGAGDATDGATSTDGGDDDGIDEEGNDGATSQGPGGDDGPGNGPVNPPSCLEEVTVLGSTTDVSPIGVSAEDFIAGFDGWSMPFVWLPNDGPTQIVPAGTNTEVNIGLGYSGAEIRFIDSEPNPDSPFEIDDCEDRLEFDVDVVFSTLDGRFDESYTAVGIAGAGGDFRVEEYFEADGLSGTFSDAEVTFNDGMGEVTRFAIFFMLGDEGPEGSVNMEVLLQFGDNPDEAAVGFGVIAAFPSLPE